MVRDFQLTETADFWREAPEIARGEIKPEDIGTEVFFFPAAAHTEKDGSFTNTQRLLQWHHKAVEPQGDTRSELDFIYQTWAASEEALRERIRSEAQLAHPRSDLGLSDSWPAE